MGFPSRRTMLILNDTVMRTATALILLFSFLPVPIASAACRECCNRSFEDHRLTLCHDKAHTHLGPHVRHMNHVHMVTLDSDSVALHQGDHQLQDGGLSCQSAVCLSTRPVPASVASAPANQRQNPAHLVETGPRRSRPCAAPSQPCGICQTAITGSPSASAPLRI